MSEEKKHGKSLRVRSKTKYKLIKKHYEKTKVLCSNTLKKIVPMNFNQTRF